MQLIGELYSPDLALLPIGDQALRWVPSRPPTPPGSWAWQHVVPMHYSPDVMPIFTGTPEKFQEHVTEIAPDVTVHVMEPGDDLLPDVKAGLRFGRVCVLGGFETRPYVIVIVAESATSATVRHASPVAPDHVAPDAAERAPREAEGEEGYQRCG